MSYFDNVQYGGDDDNKDPVDVSDTESTVSSEVEEEEEP